MATRETTKTAGPISIRIEREGEFDIFQTDMGWKYSIPFFGTAQELAEHLETLSRWLRLPAPSTKQGGS